MSINLNIRTRLALQFTLMVAAIIILLSVSIYYFSACYRETSFYSRIKDRALTTARLLIEVQEVDASLLKIIDKNTINALFDEKVVIYDYQDKLIYSSMDDITIPVSKALLNKIRLEKEIKYHEGKNEVLGILYADKYNRYVVIASALDKYGLSKLGNLKIILLIGFFFSILIAMIAGWVYSGRALKPMKEVVTQVSKITVSNLNVRVGEGNGTDEIAQLAITFNRMLERLGAAFEMQRSFVSNASHELRTPLTAISGQIEVALLKERRQKEYETILHSVLEDIKNLGKLSNNLLDLAKASSDISEIKLKELRIDELLLEAQIELRKRNPSYIPKLYFAQTIEEESHLVFSGNAHLLRTAFINLMDNGCKFSAAQSVTVSLSSINNSIQIQFQDQGMGIEKEEQKKIFQPFYRANNARTISGHGLGLSLTKKIVEIHKGTLTLASEPDKGTLVTITLPVFSKL